MASLNPNRTETEAASGSGEQVDPSSIPFPSNASKEYKSLLIGLQYLLKGLTEHPAFQANLEAYMTGNPPPEARNKVYFMANFVRQSRDMVIELDPALPARQKAKWKDVVGRCVFQDMLIQDTTGQLSMMVPEKPGQEIDFGDEVRRLSRESHAGVKSV